MIFVILTLSHHYDYQFFFRLVVVLSQNFIRIQRKMNELFKIIFTWVNLKCAPFCRVLKQPFWSRNGRSEAVFATISFKVIFCLHLWQLLTTKIWNFVDIFTRDDFMLVFVIVGGFYNSWFFDNCAFLYIGKARDQNLPMWT